MKKERTKTVSLTQNEYDWLKALLIQVNHELARNLEEDNHISPYSFLRRSKEKAKEDMERLEAFLIKLGLAFLPKSQ